MVKNFYFDNDMTGDHMEPLIHSLEEMLETDHNIRLFFNSGGGENPMLMMLMMLITDNPNRIELVFTHQASSAALDLLLFAPCKVKVGWSTISIMHLIGISTTDERGMDRNLSRSQERFEALDKENELFIGAMTEAGLDPVKIELIRKHGDVVLGRDEIVRLRESIQELVKTESKVRLFRDNLLCV